MQWILPQSDSLAKLADALAGKYHLNSESSQAEHLLIVDDFVNHIIRSGCLLVRQGETYQLYSEEAETLEFSSKKPFHFAADIAESEFRQRLRSLISVRKLDAVQEFDLQRQFLTLRNADDKAVLKMELLTTLNRQILLLKPVRGYEKALKQVTMQLIAMKAESCEGNLPQVLLTLSDYQISNYSLRPQLNLPQDILARDAVAEISLTMLSVARQNEMGILHHCEDTEYLHDYRVCLRKVRSLVSLLKGVFPQAVFLELKKRLGLLAGKTNKLRDLDVYLLKQDDYQARLPDNLRDGLPAMFSDFSLQQKRARRAVKTWLQSEAYASEINAITGIFRDVGTLPETDLSHQSLQTLIKKKSRKCFRKIGEMGVLITPETEDEEVHELRKECKKFRYLLDFFGPLLQHDKVPEMAARLRKLQNTLGKFNDYSVQQDALMQYLEAGKRGDDLAKSIGALILILAQAQQLQREKVELRFADFYSPETKALADQLFQ
ncbi:CHAD domain-containing protein [Ketobacter sp.]